VLPHIQAGTLRALASTPAKRPSTAPNLPTMTEAGVDLDASLWFAIWAPSGTSREVIDKLSRTGNEAIKTAEAQTIFKAQGFDAIGGTPEEFAVVQAQELTKWKGAVDAAGLRK
jgi:tripartite-type tricarboxylate transporter receptor subunit TctC